MADQRTMAQLLQAPTEGYENAIVVPAITADNFELKHGLLTLVQNKRFFGYDKEDPHAHIRYFNKITSTLKFPNVPNTFKDLLRAYPHHGFSELHQLDTFYNALNSKDQDSLNSSAGGNFLDKMPRECLAIIESKFKVRYSRNNLVVAKVSTNTSSSGISPDVAELKDMVKALLLDQKSQNQAPATMKAVEEIYVTCGDAHSYRNCPATDVNVYHDNIQEFVSQASAVNYNQGNTNYRPLMIATKDTVYPTNNGSTEDVQPQVVQSKSPILTSEPVNSPIIELVASPVSAPRSNQRPSIPYPSRMQDQKLRELTLRVGKEAITFNLDQTSRYSANYIDMTAKRIDVIDMACEEYSQEVLGFSDVIASGNPTPYYDSIISTISSTLTPFENSDFLLEEVDAFLALEDDPTSSEVDQSYLDSDWDILLLGAFLIDDPLLPPPNQGNYLPEVRDDKLPVIISKDLNVEEKTALITVLKSHKRAIAWKLSDIKEVLKLLDAGLIYPISDSSWVSPVHCIPKKGGFTVVENEDNELILTRLITGWRVCIDYRKLNEATRKDHFPLPFIDQMLERLAGNRYYCFLDGFSGYFQIPIDPKDQEKTTFTCPYKTFAYRCMPFGLCNAPCMFQRCMIAIFHDMIEKTMEVFMDDFSIFRNSFQSCLSHLEKMLKRCEDTNLCLNWKSHFMVKEGIVLGHKISKQGIKVDKAKVDVITKLPHPTTVKGVHTARKPLTLSRLATIDPPGDTMALFTQPKSDRGTHFCNDQFAKVMQKFGVTHRLATPYHLQTRANVEVSNHGLKRILERIVGENRASWSDKLDDALWSFQTACKTPIECTPYKLVYGKACHLLIKLEHKAYWALKHANFDLQTSEDLALNDNEGWNDARDFAKPVKAIALPQDVPSTFDHRLIKLENQVQRLMEAHLAPTQPTQVNKITTSCEIYSGPTTLSIAWKILNKPLLNNHPRVPMKREVSGILLSPTKIILVTPTIRHGKVTPTLGLVSNFMASQDARLSKFKADFKQQQSEMTNKIDTVLKAITDRIMGTLPSDMVKNSKLSTSLVMSARSYPTIDPPNAHLTPLPRSMLSKRAPRRYIESLKLGKNILTFVQGEVLAKMKDPRLFTLPCRLGDSKPFDTLADLGSYVNIIPLYIFKKLNIRLLEETNHIFGLANETKSYPIGIVKDVEIHIGKLKLLNDFYVIDMKKDPETPLLVGRGFLATANAVIDCKMAKLAVGEGIVTPEIF
nr:reverse transcriptase domain-containing protein [Tanacetum cinerariifolium]